MTEKRFKVNEKFDWAITDTVTNENYCPKKEIVDLVNELFDENEQLKQEIEKLHEQIFARSVEFKSLHNNYRTLKLQDDDRKQYQSELENENGQLKRLIDDIKKGRVYDDKRVFLND